MVDSFRVSGKEYVILDMLRSGVEIFGLAMVKSSHGHLKRGTVYVTLSRMEEKGFVTSRSEKAARDPGMPRRLYKISGTGILALKISDDAHATFYSSAWGASYA